MNFALPRIAWDSPLGREAERCFRERVLVQLGMCNSAREEYTVGTCESRVSSSDPRVDVLILNQR